MYEHQTIQNGVLSTVTIKGIESEFSSATDIISRKSSEFIVVRACSNAEDGDILKYLAVFNYINPSYGRDNELWENDVYFIDEELGKIEVYSGTSNVEAMKIVNLYRDEINPQVYAGFQQLLEGVPCSDDSDESPEVEIESIVDEAMIRIVLKGINKDGKDSKDLSNPNNSFIKSEPISDNSCIAIYQANYDKTVEEDKEELPDVSTYTYNVFAFDGSALKIHKNCTETQARAVYDEYGGKFWLDR